MDNVDEKSSLNSTLNDILNNLNELPLDTEANNCNNVAADTNSELICLVEFLSKNFQLLFLALLYAYWQSNASANWYSYQTNTQLTETLCCVLQNLSENCCGNNKK